MTWRVVKRKSGACCGSITDHWTIANAKRRGVTPSCTLPAHYMIDGKPYCATHAQRVALELLLTEEWPAAITDDRSRIDRLLATLDEAQALAVKIKADS